jgi:hypothetical protein
MNGRSQKYGPPLHAGVLLRDLSNHAFPGSAYAGVAKIGVWACAAFATLFGALTLFLSPPPVTERARNLGDAARARNVRH